MPHDGPCHNPHPSSYGCTCHHVFGGKGGGRGCFAFDVPRVRARWHPAPAPAPPGRRVVPLPTELDLSNRIVRAYPTDKHRFARIAFADDDGGQLYVAVQDPDSSSTSPSPNDPAAQLRQRSGSSSGRGGGGYGALAKEERRRAKKAQAEAERWVDYLRGKRARPEWEPKPHNTNREVLRRLVGRDGGGTVESSKEIHERAFLFCRGSGEGLGEGTAHVEPASWCKRPAGPAQPSPACAV